jgi:hypothetical protein
MVTRLIRRKYDSKKNSFQDGVSRFSEVVTDWADANCYEWIWTQEIFQSVDEKNPDMSLEEVASHLGFSDAIAVAWSERNRG